LLSWPREARRARRAWLDESPSQIVDRALVDGASRAHSRGTAVADEGAMGDFAQAQLDEADKAHSEMISPERHH
jgi:hypothetical protein